MEKSQKNRFKTWLSKIKKKILVGGFLVPFIILLLVIVGYSGWQLTYQPKSSCNLCHNIQPYVSSYYGSEYLDHLHQDANVGCKDCHHADLSKMVGEAITYVKGDYQDPMRETELSKDVCLTCHRSYKAVREQTDYLTPNPHESPHDANMECTTCHNSHRKSEVLCDQCHQFIFKLP